MFNTENQNSFTHSLFVKENNKILQIPKQRFTAKITNTIERFKELDLFRQEIQDTRAGFHHQPYTNHKTNILFYRSIFFGFAILFALLASIAILYPSATGCGFFFSCSVVKTVIAIVCTTLSCCSFVVAYKLSAEREAIYLCVRKARAHLSTIYARKRAKMGIKRFFAFFGRHRQQAMTLSHLYHEALDKICEKKEEFLHLTHRIINSRTIDLEEKETLLNQALEELHDHLMLYTQNFRHAPLP